MLFLTYGTKCKLINKALYIEYNYVERFKNRIVGICLSAYDVGYEVHDVFYVIS